MDTICDDREDTNPYPTTTMIEIIENPPVIFTKDKSFVTYKPLQPGDIIHLPEDAVLLVLPINHPTN